MVEYSPKILANEDKATNKSEYSFAFGLPVDRKSAFLICLAGLSNFIFFRPSSATNPCMSLTVNEAFACDLMNCVSP